MATSCIVAIYVQIAVIPPDLLHLTPPPPLLFTFPSPYLGTPPLGTLPGNLETLQLPSFDAENPTSLAQLVSELAQDTDLTMPKP